MLVFDNGGSSGYGFAGPIAPNGVGAFARATSRVLEINPVTLELVWSYAAPRFFSTNISGAQRLPNGNTLITEGAGGRVFEVTNDSAIVWEYMNPLFAGPRPSNDVYRAYRLPYDWIPQLARPRKRRSRRPRSARSRCRSASVLWIRRFALFEPAVQHAQREAVAPLRVTRALVEQCPKSRSVGLGGRAADLDRLVDRAIAGSIGVGSSSFMPSSSVATSPRAAICTDTSSGLNSSGCLGARASAPVASMLTWGDTTDTSRADRSRGTAPRRDPDGTGAGLTAERPGVRLIRAWWLPDGRHAVAWAVPENGPPQLYRLEVDGSTTQAVDAGRCDGRLRGLVPIARRLDGRVSTGQGVELFPITGGESRRSPGADARA